MTFRRATARSIVVLITGMCVLFVLLTACAWSAEPPAPGAAPAEEVAQRPLSMSELSEAKLLLSELDEQIRIAGAKLDRESLARKRELGKTKTLIDAVDEQIRAVAAEVERRRERTPQLCQEFQTFVGDDNDSRSELATRCLAALRSTEERLEKLSRYRTRLEQRLSDLRREHVQKLLEAAVSPDTSAADDVTPLERILDEEFGAVQAGSQRRGRLQISISPCLKLPSQIDDLRKLWI